MLKIYLYEVKNKDGFGCFVYVCGVDDDDGEEKEDERNLWDERRDLIHSLSQS